jgi:acetyl-CoA carboxylase biotin carboxyl carrier protein
MANEKSSQDGSDSDSGEVFDIERVRQLVALMKEHELSEIDLRHASKRIRLRSGQETTFVTAAAPPSAAAAPVPAASITPAAPLEPDNATIIKSPMVGTFYTCAKPGDPPFVKVGDQVSPDTVVCIVEAMKMFNEIPAGVSGKVVGIIARN